MLNKTLLLRLKSHIQRRAKKNINLDDRENCCVKFYLQVIGQQMS